MLRTRFTDLLECTAPVQVAAMPGVSTVELAAAVAEAGGLGMLGTPLLTPDALEGVLGELDEATSGATGVNFLMPFLDPACVAVAARRSRVVEFFYGDPDRQLVDEVHSHGARVSWQVGSVDEARSAERAGCDLLIAQGTEAGGHVRGRTSLLPLLSQVLDAVAVPVLAAGGIASARDLAAVLACGAAGARLGTRFLASNESGAHPDYVRAVLAASAGDTCLTEAFSVMWPDAPHRVLTSSIGAAEALADPVVGETRQGDQSLPVQRLSVMCPTRETTGHVEAMALYAGESVASILDVRPAAEIVAELTSGAEQLLAGAAG